MDERIMGDPRDRVTVTPRPIGAPTSLGLFLLVSGAAMALTSLTAALSKVVPATAVQGSLPAQVEDISTRPGVREQL